MVVRDMRMSAGIATFSQLSHFRLTLIRLKPLMLAVFTWDSLNKVVREVKSL